MQLAQPYGYAFDHIRSLWGLKCRNWKHQGSWNIFTRKNLSLNFSFKRDKLALVKFWNPPLFKSTIFPCILDSALVTSSVLSQGEFPFTAVWMAAGVKWADLSVVSALQCKAESRDKMHALCKCKDKLITSTAACMTNFLSPGESDKNYSMAYPASINYGCHNNFLSCTSLLRTQLGKGEIRIELTLFSLLSVSMGDLS